LSSVWRDTIETLLVVAVDLRDAVGVEEINETPEGVGCGGVDKLLLDTSMGETEEGAAIGRGQ
jgi:hypothetical protein